MQIIDVAVRRWTLPLRAPFRIATRTALEALNVTIAVRTSNPDITGYGASAPVMYVTGESVESVVETVNAAAEALVGKSCDRLGVLLKSITPQMAGSPAALAGLEMALYDLWAKQAGISLWNFLGGSEMSIATDLTIPLTSAGEGAEIARNAYASGIRTFKIKVGHDDGFATDLARIDAIIKASPGCNVRIDANQAFHADEALEFLDALRPHRDVIELIEQPVDRQDMDGLRKVRDRSGYPIFADEAACSPADVMNLIHADAVDGINVKLMKSGITAALDIMAICRSAGKKLMIGCMLESGVGISAAAAIAAGTGAFDCIDLDSHKLLAPIPGLEDGFTSDGECLVIRRNALGWGVSPPSAIFCE